VLLIDRRAASVATVGGRRGRRGGDVEAGLPGAEVVDDRLRRRRADPGDAERHDLEQRVERPDPSGGLDLGGRRRVGSHEPQVVMGGAARGEAGGCLDELGPGRLGQATGADLLVVGEIGVLEDHLDDRATGVGDVDHRGDIGQHLGIPVRLERADREDHVDLGRAVGERLAGLEHLRVGPVVAVRKADGRADRHVGPVENALRAADVGRTHAHGRDVVGRRQAATGLDERIVELRTQQGVIDRLRDVALGQTVDQQGVGHVSGSTAEARRGR
jgi:hypothetical protein